MWSTARQRYIRLPANQTSTRRGAIGRSAEDGCALGEVEPTLGKHFLDVTIAQGEAQTKPNRVLNHGRREAVPAIRDRKHPRNLRGSAAAKLS